MRRTKEDAEMTRATLLKVALGVFSAQGYAATTLEDIARAAGVTRGAIYWHFGGKAELYNTLVREYTARGTAVVQEVVAQGGTLLEILRRIFEQQLALVEDDAEVRALIELALFKTEQTPELEAGRRFQLEAGQAMLAHLTEAIRHGIETGEIRSDLQPDDVARAFLALQNGVIQLWLLSSQSFSLKSSAVALADILMSGIQNK